MTHPLIQWAKNIVNLIIRHVHTHTHTHTRLQDVIVQHSLPLVSFSADVKRTKQEIFSYIAKTSPKAKEYICYAYEVPRGQVQQIQAPLQ